MFLGSPGNLPGACNLPFRMTLLTTKVSKDMRTKMPDGVQPLQMGLHGRSSK